MRYLTLNVGASVPNPDTKDFSGKVSCNFKSFAKIKWRIRWEILLLTFLIRKVREGGLERSSNILRQIKKHGVAVLFECVLNVGASAPNPDTKDFSGKVLWNLKSFARMKRYIRHVILLFLCAINFYCFRYKFGSAVTSGAVNVFLETFVAHVHLSESL